MPAKVFTIGTFNLENLDDSSELWPVRRNVLRSMLLRMDASLLFLQEVNSLSALNDLVKGTAYEEYEHACTVKTDGTPYARRNLVTLSRYPIQEEHQYFHEFTPAPVWRLATAQPPLLEAQKVEWERPVLHCKVMLGGGRVLHAINLHLKSKNPTDIPGQKSSAYAWLTHEGWAEGYFLSSVKRIGQALEVRRLLEHLFKQDFQALIAVGGDFNSDAADVPFKTIVGSVEETNNPGLRSTVMVPCEYNVPQDKRYSLIYRGKGEMIDHIIVSQAFYPYWVETVVFNELLPDKSVAFATAEKFPESDHAPVVARFSLPKEWLP